MDAPPALPRTERPARVLPTLYFAAAHVALAAAFAAVALDPRGVAGFFYHSRMLAIVHLVTLGWITASILGSLYIVGPVALRTSMAARWHDYLAFVFVIAGITGMVAHFWLDRPSGMAWSASVVGVGILIVGVHAIWRVCGAPIPRAIAAHLVLAFANVLGAALLGILVGFDKVHHFLGGFVLANVFAHAHLAAIGWAMMMVVGVAYRLLPMVIPSAVPAGRQLWASAVLLETGVVGLFVTLIARSPLVAAFAAVSVAGLAVFFSQVIWMLRRPRRRPPGVGAFDPALLHAAAAFVSLGAACALGMWLSVAATSPATLRVAMAYGVFGLVGFLAQIVVAMEGRLLPILAWFWALSNTVGGEPVPSPARMRWPAGQELVFVLWLAGVPALAAGLAFDAVPFVRGAAWSLFAAAILDSIQAAAILRHAFVTATGSSSATS